MGPDCKAFTNIIFGITLMLCMGLNNSQRKICASLEVSIEYREVSVEKHSKRTELVEEACDFQRVLDELAITAGIDFGVEGIFGLSAQGSYDKLTENEENVNRELRITTDEDIDFQKGFTQILKDTTTVMTVNGYPGLVKESEYIDSQYVGEGTGGGKDKPVHPKEIVDLQEMANRDISALYGDLNGTIRQGTYREDLCLEG